MPRNRKRFYLSDLRYEPEARSRSGPCWAKRASPLLDGDDLWQAVDSLSRRERLVIVGRFGLDGLPQTLETIGQFLGCTRERVRQVESSALDKLKKRLTRA
jgi:DNA-directed RNA polymerase sigma subunit (sigma70/sigma32)